MAYFISEGSQIDTEALNRGHSKYVMKDFFMPMLPRLLNNNICSLLPNQPRFAISLYFVISEEGIIDMSSINYKYNLIKNSYKLSYERADQLIMGDADPDKAEL